MAQLGMGLGLTKEDKAATTDQSASNAQVWLSSKRMRPALRGPRSQRSPQTALDATAAASESAAAEEDAEQGV